VKRSLSLGLFLSALLAVNAHPAACQQPSASNAPQTAAKPNAHDEKIYNRVFKLIGQDVTVRLNGGKEWHGRVSSVEDTSFKLVEVDLGQVILISYRDTKKLYEGYTERNVLGKRINPHTRKITGYVVLAGLVGFFAILASQIK
jgi:small nuclear ribonucleoprotein (snRNP)-like protein